MKAIIPTIGALGLVTAAAAVAGTVPGHFQLRAKELLADSIELAPNAHQVNVVYFVPSDAKPVADYERRLSELLLYLQQFYGKEMQRNGYGNRSFGLRLKDNGNVDIILIQAKGPRADYPYEGGAAKCLQEVEAYFAAHPEKKASQHTFILMPTFYNGEYNDLNPGGVPFYGVGRNCFALDYAHFDIKHLGRKTHEGKLLTKWYGGFAHELGHGLNLPHNDGPASMNRAHGTPLMGAGNYTFGQSPTYMTPASCAILAHTEVFAGAGDPTEFYTQQEEPAIYGASLVRTEDALRLRLELSADCVQVNAYVQDPPYQVNRDYDCVAFVGKMKEITREGAGKVAEVMIPLAELSHLQHRDKGELELGILLQTAEGSRFRWRNVIDLGRPESLKLEAKPTLRRGY